MWCGESRMHHFDAYAAAWDRAAASILTDAPETKRRAGARDRQIDKGVFVSPASSLTLDPKTTALVLIDLEHGIVAMPVVPHSGADVVKRSAALASALREAGGTVVYVHVLLHDTISLPVDKPMQRGAPPAEASELVPDAGFQPGTDILVTKRQWDAFHATHLDQALRRKGVKTIVLAGIATNLGVESTARSAQARGYELVFASDAMATLSEAMQQFALEQMFPLMGRVRTSEEIAAALRG